ncbi:Na+ dependent nucleoside transporter C-terminus-domain-containing protein [Thamnocephalis sphaerospora]|uniref:Na+ dependent nucleoside transporter C-terminus-domain-containing protein n=1 Tax=Thamnocephalis sphaerospora TaxID=78915 RepID=A0A4P9XLH9_9FUNG|nr:Na+ dependent nucleoside transporter C-terminus-domain-containing protein [Thamnocephalis sphaerospora]|eukprot:RKP06130.1 Na+ dependent nucleoside transporter C-terminus-domain-containing protein [Thamnocephalis sphaerospora]
MPSEKRAADGNSTRSGSFTRSPADDDDEEPEGPSRLGQLYQRYRVWAHLLIWSLITAYFVSAVVLNPSNGWVALTLLYVFITGKMFFKHVSTSHITRPVGYGWRCAIERPWFRINRRVRYGIGFFVPLAVMLTTALAAPESESGTRLERLVSFFGLIIIIGGLWITSNDRKAVKWRIVLVGVSMQFILGVFILKTTAGYEIFHWISEMASSFLDFSKRGAAFVLGEETANANTFAVSVLPGVLFFASFIQIVYYLGGMQWIVKKFAWLMVRLMDTSGAESVVAAASPFVGQGESALLVKPFIKDMTRSEIHSTMCSGFATIAGSVLIAFISLGIEPQALLTACVMSTPCSLAVSKLRYPEKQQSLSKGRIIIPKDEDRESNALHAAANGAAQGVHLIMLIAGTLLAIISLLALVDALLTWFGSFVGIDGLTLIAITKYIFVPFAWIIGIPTADVLSVANLMASKMFVNEFVAYLGLSAMKKAMTMTLRGQLLATYALCGFANFASIGIQIGCIGAMAPTRKRDLARLAVSAMVSGTMSTFMTACIAGMIL